jgi:1-acyl-sn-glycerol-3-phosphate acyltransferase
MKPSSFVMKPGKIRVKLLAPISTVGLTQKELPQLKAEVVEKMQAELVG